MAMNLGAIISAPRALGTQWPLIFSLDAEEDGASNLKVPSLPIF